MWPRVRWLAGRVVLLVASLQDWVPVWRMWALQVTRSAIAAASRGRGIRLPHSSERQVGRQADGGFLLPFGDDLEQQSGSSRVEADVAEFVEQEQVEAAVPGHDAGQLPAVGSLGELVDELRGGGVADAASLLAGG